MPFIGEDWTSLLPSTEKRKKSKENYRSQFKKSIFNFYDKVEENNMESELNQSMEEKNLVFECVMIQSQFGMVSLFGVNEKDQ